MLIDDSFKIKNLIEIEKGIFLHGALTSKERLFSLEVFCDGNKTKPYVWEVSKEQYEFFVVLPLSLKQLDIIFKTEVEQKHILTLDKEEMNIGIIASNITSVSPAVGITEVKGWVVSKNKVSISIRNVTNNKICDSSIRRMKYQKLNDCNVVPKGEMSGFILSFIREEGNEYEIIFDNGSEKKAVSLSEFFVERSANKKLSLGTAFKRISPKMIKRFFEYLHENGLKETIYKIMFGMQEEFDYDAWFRRNQITEKELEEQKKVNFSYSPKISIITPTFNTPKDLLIEMIESVREQSYSNWELCLADGSDVNNEAREILKEYTKKDSRIKVVYLDKNYGISGNTNKALELVTGEYTGLFDHDDVLEKDALYEIVKSLQEKHHDIIYTDEDKLNGKTLQYEDPNLKSDYNEDLLLSHNYITHFFVVKTDIIRSAGGFHSEYDGAQDYDVILKCIEKTSDIHHISKVLYHWRMHEGSTALDPESKMYCYIAGEKAIQHHLDRLGIKAQVQMREKPYWGLYHVKYDTGDNPLVSVIIPNYEHSDILKTCIDSLFHVNTYNNIEVIIVENNSKEQKTFDYYETLQKEHRNVKVVKWDGIFNFSAINNFGVKYATGDYLLFLNNDTEMIEPDSISEMLGTCMRENVGVVGSKLIYADNTIQHDGVVIGFAGYARHIFNDIDGIKEPGFMMRAQVNCDYSAATAACMMTKKSLFEEIGGFDEGFVVACNDIDYCLQVRKKNKLVVLNRFSLWHHFESKSRGYENSLDKVKRFNSEVERWQGKWKDILEEGDPYYNLNFKLEDEPFELH